MKIKFITCIYSDLHGTKFGGRASRGSHYRYSLLSLLKMTDADFVCYTSENELKDLEYFFYETYNVDKQKLKFSVYDLENTKYKDLINPLKNIGEMMSSDRCYEIQYSKFAWWWNEDKTYDYYYWIDAGLSHCGVIPNKYLPSNTGSLQGYYESSIFDNNFLKNLISFTGEKFFIVTKDNVANFWAHPLNSKWYINPDNRLHVIGGIFGGKKESWDTMITNMERYLENVLVHDKMLPSEENILTLAFYNHQDDFVTKYFDIWWHIDSGISFVNQEYFLHYKSFYKVLEELID